MGKRANRAASGDVGCSEPGCGRAAVTRCAVCGRALCGRHGYKTWWWVASGAHYGMVCEGCRGGEAEGGETAH
jgi:hypothetical protein